MKFKVSILGIVLALSYSMGNEFAELFSDYAFYEGYPAGTHPDRDGNPLNAYNRLHGLVKFEQDKGSSQATVLEGNYIDGKKDGVFQLKSTVYEGVVLEETTYKNGQLDGESKKWVFIPKETDSPKEYHILVEKSLYEAGAERQKIELAVGSYIDYSHKISIRKDMKITHQSSFCNAINFIKTELYAENKHSYAIQIYNKHKDKMPNYCASQYGFFETLLERFEKGEFNPFSNDSDYQMGKPFIEFVKYYGRDREEGVIVFQNGGNGGEVFETIIETINDATYKLEFRPDSRKNYMIFTKNGMEIDPRVYNQEEFNILLNKMYNKEISSLIAENLTNYKIN